MPWRVRNDTTAAARGSLTAPWFQRAITALLRAPRTTAGRAMRRSSFADATSVSLRRSQAVQATATTRCTAALSSLRGRAPLPAARAVLTDGGYRGVPELITPIFRGNRIVRDRRWRQHRRRRARVEHAIARSRTGVSSVTIGDAANICGIRFRRSPSCTTYG